MRKALLVGVLYFLAAFTIEHGILPAFRDLWPGADPGGIRLVALGAILAGCLRRDLEAAAFALLAGLIVGAATSPGYLGSSCVSFVLSAYAASLAVRWFYLERFFMRFAVLFGLILLESWSSSEVRHLLWPDLIAQVHWKTALITALIGTLLYIPLARWVRYRPGPFVAAGRPRGF